MILFVLHSLSISLAHFSYIIQDTDFRTFFVINLSSQQVLILPNFFLKTPTVTKLGALFPIWGEVFILKSVKKIFN